MNFSRLLGACCLLACSPHFVFSEEVQRVAEQIDRRISAFWTAQQIQPAPLADDAEFFRRVYLDLGGKIPTTAEVRQFLADKSPNKRREIVERLLESPAYVENFTDYWREVLLQDANPETSGGVYGLETWLRRQMIDNTPYDQFAQEILSVPSFQLGSSSGPSVFYSSRPASPEVIAAATARTFLGVRVECAQCHDHPFDDWERESFWSFAAFYASLKQIMPEEGVFRGVEASKEWREITIPGTETTVAAKYLDGGKPQWLAEKSPRVTLARWITSADNKYFARTVVNRTWAHFFGRGFVNPVDDFRDSRPPSHPRLLDELTREFIAAKFDMKFLIRAITASRAYQRSSEKTHASQTPQSFARMAVKGMTPPQLHRSLLRAVGTYEGGEDFAGQEDFRQKFFEWFSRTDAPTESQTTILQALAMMNGPHVTWATDLQKSKTLSAVLAFPGWSDADRIETLFLASLSRPPRPDEAARLLKYVKTGGPKKDRKEALADVFWALLNSSEFMLNH